MERNSSTAFDDMRDVRYYDVAVDEKQERLCKSESHQSDFISIDDFSNKTMEFAKFCEQKQIYPLVQALVKLCVRINVPIVSEERKNIKTDESDRYKYNQHKPKLGSGTILDIQEHKVQISTAKHVVFNSEEAQGSSCDIHYDGLNSQTVTITGAKEKECHSDVNNDWCKFVCVIEEKELSKIKELLEECKREKLKLKRTKCAKRKRAILISHPHGCYKYISIGDQKYEMNGFIIYETPSCDGSSGGYVLPIGYQTDGVYVHSGICKFEGKICGYSSGVIQEALGTIGANVHSRIGIFEGKICGEIQEASGPAN